MNKLNDLKQNLSNIDAKLFSLASQGKEIPQELRDRKTEVFDAINLEMGKVNLIYTNPNKAYYALITTAELYKQFTKLKNEYELPNVLTIGDLDKATEYALLKMFA